MSKSATSKFFAIIEIIGINPFVYLPEETLQAIFKQSGKSKGKIPVKIKIEGHEFPQTLVKYSGHWRLYLNAPMRTIAKREVGDKANFEIRFDPDERIVAMHPKFKAALAKNSEAKEIFDHLAPSLQLEIVRYLSFLKKEESVDKNVIRAINFLLGRARFVGRDNP